MSDVTQFKLDTRGSAVADKTACLIMIRGDYIGQVYTLEGRELSIGRSDDCDLTLSDIQISREHACIEQRGDGYYLVDLASTNGCWVNGDQVNASVRLFEGDKVWMGQIVFKFSYQDKEDAEYHRAMRNMTIKDDLTGIFNKRYFKESLDKEFAYARRQSAALSIILFDIDHFKSVNDNHGHPAGDNVLKQLSELIVDDVRGYDLFARYGGEEFAFLIKGETTEESIRLAERVREVIASHEFEYDGERLRVTVSLGVASLGVTDGIDSPEDLIAAVDRCLYAAKEGGRNRVCH